MPTYFPFTTWLVFPDQWDPKSPWHDRRVRLAANLAIDRHGINQAVYLGLAKLTDIVHPAGHGVLLAAAGPTPTTPSRPSSSWPRRAIRTASTPAISRGDTIYGAAIGEPVVNYLQRGRHPRSGCGPWSGPRSSRSTARRSCAGVIFSGSGAPGNAATRLEQYAVTGGRYAYGAYPDIDGLFGEQANEMNPRVRQQILHKIQQLIHEKVMFGPVIEPAFLNGVGPRLEVHGLGADRQLRLLGAPTRT